MVPLPKRRYPKARQGDRRSHLAVTPPQLVECTQCHSAKLPHRYCPTCGTYAGQEVVEVEKSKKKSA